MSGMTVSLDKHLGAPRAEPSLPPLVLSFFGPPCVLGSQGPQPFRFKYRKAAALLAFVASQPGRPVRRELLAELLWPQLGPAAAKANLRVALADLSKQWAAMGLPQVLGIEREQLTFRVNDEVVLDGLYLKSRHAGALGNAFSQGDTAHWAHVTGSAWLAGMDEGVSDDLLDWLAFQRQSLDESLGQARKPAPQGEVDIPRLPDLASLPEMAVLTLLRVECAESAVGTAQAAAVAAFDEVLPDIAALLVPLGGEILASDDIGCTLMFGRLNWHTGARWQALRAASALWQRLGTALPLRMGATAGRLQLSWVGERPRVQGWRARLVERLALYADVAELVCCDSFSDLVGHVGARVEGPVQFRGIERLFTLHVQPLRHSRDLAMPALSGGGLLTHFVGRQPVMDKARTQLAHAVQGERRGLTLAADAGLGKTRIAWEVSRQAQAGGHGTWWFGGRPEARLSPWRGLQEGLLAQVSGGQAVALDAWLDDWAARCGMPLRAERRDILLSVLGGQGVSQRDRPELLLALSDMWSARGPGQAHCIVVDDLQWLDDATVDVLSRLSVQVPGVLWLCTQRQRGGPWRLAIQSEGDGVHDLVRLAPLDDDSAAELVASLPGGAELDASQRKGRILNARGVPLYLLADVAGSGDTHPHFGEFCNAMLNRLGADRLVLQVASVLGMRFLAQDLVVLCGKDESQRAMEQAQAAGLLVDRGGAYLAFFHPRLREYLLSTLSPPALVAWSSRCAALLQARDDCTSAAELWLQARQPDAARRCWLLAATYALERDDLLAARSAFDQLGQLDYGAGVDGMRARARHVRCLLALQGYGSPQAHRITQVIRDSLPQWQGYPDLAFDALSLSYLHASGESNEQGLAHAQQMIRQAREPEAVHTACWAMANSLFWLGQHDEARPWFARMLETGAVLTAAQRMRYFPSDPLVFGQCQIAWMEWLHGQFEVSAQALDQAWRCAQLSSKRQDLAIFHTVAALLGWLEGRATDEHVQMAEDVADAEGLIFWGSFAALLQAIQTAGRGLEVDLGAISRQADTVLEGYPSAQPIALWLASEALVACGHFDMAVTLADQCLLTMADQAHGTCRMELWRIKALALHRLGQTDAARLALQQALLHGQPMAGWLHHRGRLI